MYHARDRNSIISAKAALQRLIIQRLKDRPRPSDVVYVPILVRFMMPGVDIPRPPGSSATSNSVHESRSRRSHAGPPSVIDTSVQVEVPAATEASRNEATAPPNVNVDVTPTLPSPPPRHSADNRSTLDLLVDMDRQQWLLAAFKVLRTMPHPAHFLFGGDGTHWNAYPTPTRMHPFSAEVTFGAESFEDYMSQFMCGEVKFKDFRKASIPKFDSTGTIHLYTGTSCSVPRVSNGECGARHTNLRKKIPFTASGGLGYRLPFARRMLYVRAYLHRPKPGVHFPRWVKRARRR
ncbi:hypothetical protein MHU86_21657 [Fragilaria crotonensis]|nr:hypothetical protein MHU86_21657 [Fragilaria crotonensis]